jgi:hypothetical protein
MSLLKRGYGRRGSQSLFIAEQLPKLRPSLITVVRLVNSTPSSHHREITGQKETHMTAYANANHLAGESLAPNNSPEAMVDNKTPMERYEMKVRSLANHTLASTLTGVSTFLGTRTRTEGSLMEW